MTDREIETLAAQARELESAARLLRRATRLLDDGAAVKTAAGALVLIVNAQAGTRHQILAALDRMRDRQIDAAPLRTTAAVDALRNGMHDAVNRLLDGPQD